MTKPVHGALALVSGAWLMLCGASAFAAAAEPSHVALIQTIAARAMNDDHLKSIVLQVRIAGKTVYTGALGESMTGVAATPEQLITIGISKPMMFAPATNWGYSHTNYVILGRVLEKITALPLAQAMQTYVFTPLHLKQTRSFATPFIPEPLLHAFTSERREGVRCEGQSATPSIAIFSSLADALAPHTLPAPHP